MICYVAENKNDQETGDRVNYVPESCSYIVGEDSIVRRAYEKKGGSSALLATQLCGTTQLFLLFIFSFFTRVIEQEYAYIHVYIETAYHL